MEQKARRRTAALALWGGLVVLLAALVAHNTDWSKIIPPAPTATAARPRPTPNPLQEFALPAWITFPSAIVAGPDGSVWITDAGGIARVDINAGIPGFTPFAVPGGVGSLCAGPDGAVWFTEVSASKIGRIAHDGSIREFALPQSTGVAVDITAGPDGALWFTQAARIGRITVTGEVQAFSVPSPQSQPSGITAGPDGALWFTEPVAQRIGRITTDGAISEYAVPSGNAELSAILPGITTGPDDAVWFTEGPNELIGRASASGQIAEFPIQDERLPQGDRVIDITTGPDHALWFTASIVGRMNTGGIVTNRYSVNVTPLGGSTQGGIPPSGGYPQGIAATAHVIWFTMPYANAIGRIDV